MNRQTIFAALACGLLAFSMLGCNALQTTNHLQSIQISSSNTDESVTGTMSIGINGPVLGPIQLYTWGNYSNGKAVLLHGTGVAYQISIDPDLPAAVYPDGSGEYLLAAPPQTLQLSTTGLLTAVDPSACSWLNSNAGNAKATSPAWAIVGAYKVTATYSGLTTPPVYVAMASAPGVEDDNNNKTGACGPTS